MSRPRLALLLLACLTPVVGGAQDPVALAATLRREHEAAVRAERLADSTREEFRKARDAQRNQRALVAGVWLRYSAEDITAEDTAALAEGLRRARASLVERFGARGESLTPGDTLVVLGFARAGGGGVSMRIFRSPALSRGFGRVVRPSITVLRRPGHDRYDLNFPIRVADVERMALRWTGHRLPALGDFGGSQVSLASEPQVWGEAGRELALSWATTGRRCLVGALGACEIVMTTRPASGPPPAWIEPPDVRAAVSASESPPFADSAFVADRHRCLEADEAVCPSVLARMRLRDPFSTKLRGSLVMHALELGGRDAITRLADGTRPTPLAQAAHAAGMSETQLLSSWQTRVAEAVAEGQEGPLPGTLSTVGWCALLIGLTLRRRPS